MDRSLRVVVLLAFLLGHGISALKAIKPRGEKDTDANNQAEVEKDVIFVSADPFHVEAQRSSEVVRNWNRADGVYRCDQASEKLNEMIEAEKNSPNNLFQKMLSKKKKNVVLHVGQWCEELAEAYPSFIHLVDPLQGWKGATDKASSKKGVKDVGTANKTGDSGALSKGVCGVLLASNASSTRTEAAKKYGANLKQWYVPSPHLGHYKNCKPDHLTQVNRHKVLIIGMPESRVLTLSDDEKEKVNKVKYWLADAKSQDVKVDMVWDQGNWTVNRKINKGVQLSASDAINDDFQFYSSEQKVLDMEAAKSHCQWYKKATLIVLWDDCNWRDGKRTSKHDRKDCYALDSADTMATTMHLGIPTIAYGEKMSWKDLAITKGPTGDVQKDQEQLLFRLGRLVQDEKQWLRVHRQSLTMSNAFAIDQVVKNHYEPMIEEAQKSCPIAKN